MKSSITSDVYRNQRCHECRRVIRPLVKLSPVCVENRGWFLCLACFLVFSDEVLKLKTKILEQWSDKYE